MSTFPQYFTNRHLGHSTGLNDPEHLIEHKIAQNLAYDRFEAKVLSLPEGEIHSSQRAGNFLSIVSKSAQNVQNLALYALPSLVKLWDNTTSSFGISAGVLTIRIGDTGLVLVEFLESIEAEFKRVCILEGKKVGELPQYFRWYSTHIMGLRILGSVAENPAKAPWFGEWNHEGVLQRRFDLQAYPRILSVKVACRDSFWVRLLPSREKERSSTLEIVDRVLGNIKVYSLPKTIYNDVFSSECLVGNRLFYGKYFMPNLESVNIPSYFCPVIGIFDLAKGKVEKEFATGSVQGEIRHLCANNEYVAWIEYFDTNDATVKFRKLSDPTVHQALSFPRLAAGKDAFISLTGSLLSLCYPETFFEGQEAIDRRVVMDLSDGTQKTSVPFKRDVWGEHTFSEGLTVISDHFNKPERIYLEDYLCDGDGADKHGFRE